VALNYANAAAFVCYLFVLVSILPSSEGLQGPPGTQVRRAMGTGWPGVGRGGVGALGVSLRHAIDDAMPEAQRGPLARMIDVVCLYGDAPPRACVCGVWQSLVLAHDWVFSIWGAIYTLLGIFAFYQVSCSVD
jgi:hypothetical protein